MFQKKKYMYGYTYVCCMYVRIYIRMYVCMYVCMYVHIYVRIYKCITMTTTGVGKAWKRKQSPQDRVPGCLHNAHSMAGYRASSPFPPCGKWNGTNILNRGYHWEVTVNHTQVQNRRASGHHIPCMQRQELWKHLSAPSPHCTRLLHLVVAKVAGGGEDGITLASPQDEVIIIIMQQSPSRL